MKDNIVLIGMPGAGKSTVGVVLAKRLGYRFVDSDLVIQEKYDRLLHELIEEHGVEGFWRIEEEENASLNPRKSVIATGGSVIYGPRAMEHLREIGTVVYLKLPLEEVAERLGDLNARGVTLRPGQTLADLYAERVPLYEKYAHEVVDCYHIWIRDVVRKIASLL
ncbi:shikimate kinase [uncultured Acetatifactor sp.]|uniref:shikimate kinase n=1 Tax=uncultured Acetatifactor sp. TaxID=1671927 RepID=UPI0026264F47|nr:shikimate kinase [uncultured Acetatifactor sp.]